VDEERCGRRVRLHSDKNWSRSKEPLTMRLRTIYRPRRRLEPPVRVVHALRVKRSHREHDQPHLVVVHKRAENLGHHLDRREGREV
jgi:hypothetical protein